MSEVTRPPMDASSLVSSGDQMLAGMQARLDALTQPEPQKKGIFGNIKEKFKSPNLNLGGVKDKLGQAGGWVKEKTTQAGEKAGQVKENVKMSAETLKEKLQNWQKSPFGEAIETALVDFVKKDLPGTIDKLIKEKNYKKILTVAGLKIAGNTATKWALYKTQETAEKMWEKKYDIATGALSGAILRTAFITVGAEAYVAKAIASGAIAGIRRLDSELAAENKPENLKARLNLIKRLKEYPPEKRKQLARKVAVAGAFGAAGSLIGMELMEHTGLGNYLHEALASGAGKVGEVASGIGGKVAGVRDNLPQINPIEGAKELGSAIISTAGETINNIPHPSMPSIPQMPTPNLPQIDLPQIPHPNIPNPLSGAGEAANDMKNRAGDLLNQAGQKAGEIAGNIPHPESNPLNGLGEATSSFRHTAEETISNASKTAHDFGDRFFGHHDVPSDQGGPPGPDSNDGSIGQSQIPHTEEGAIQTTPSGIGQENSVQAATDSPAVTEGPAEAAAPVPAAVPDTGPVIDAHAQAIDEAIKNIPQTMPLESGGTPWSVAEHLLKSANPDGNFTPGDIMKVDQELCRLNGVAVPEWGIEGKILANRLPVGFILKTDDENLLNIVKQVASSK